MFVHCGIAVLLPPLCVCVLYSMWFGSERPASALHSPLVQSVTGWLQHTHTHTHTQGSVVGPVLQSHSSQSCPPVWLCREGGVGVWGERRGRRARQLPPMLSVSTGGMAVEGYFLLLRSAAFLVTPIPPSQSVNLARLLKHKTASSGLLPPPPHLSSNEHTLYSALPPHTHGFLSQ